RTDGILKVLDFGLARCLPTALVAGAAPRCPETDPGTLVGTALYMAPEQARAEPVGTATDVFALGVVLYELCTRKHPFLADTETGVLHAIINRAPLPACRLNPEVPAAVEALLEQMLAKDPRLRPSAIEVDAVLTELARVSKSQPGRPPPGGE